MKTNGRACDRLRRPARQRQWPGTRRPPTFAIMWMMTVQTFREMLARRPFQPVKVVLSSGQTYEIRHPEMPLLTRTSLLVGVDVSEDGVPAEFKILSLLHVKAI